MLDRETFQQLLAAAYVLQEQNEHLHPKPSRPDYTEALSDLVEIQSLIQTHQIDLQSAASLIASRVQKFTGADGAAVGLLKEDELTYQSATGIASDDGGMPVAAAASLSAHCLARGQALQSLDAQRDRRIPAELCRQAGVQSFIAVPALHDGKVAGVVELRFSNKSGFQEQDVRTCQLLTGLWADAIARSAELEWKQALASERATMIEALEKIKPQLQRIAVEPADGDETLAAIPALESAVAADTPIVCRGCGHQLEKEESYCGLCGTPRPNEDGSSGDLQSKWASLWHLKRAADIRKSEAAEEVEDQEWGDVPAKAESKEELLAPEPLMDEGVSVLPDAGKTEVVTASPWTSASQTRRWLDSFDTPHRNIWLSKHRANLYLVTAAVLLLAVIAGWGSHSDTVGAAHRGKNPAPPQLSFFEKTLVELGLAESPPLPAYHGNPDTRVWEDERTALYYCPGADLYGKTERGKFNTQREAQQDQFEPAFRRPCD